MTVEVGQLGGNALAGASTRRKIDRTSNGVLWTVLADGGNVEVWYSDDDGATWQQDGAALDTSAFQPAGAIFIDADDYAHVIWFRGTTGYVGYRRGTPNAGRTSYTWSAIHEVPTVGNQHDFCLIAHKEGTGWKVHGTWSRYFFNGQSEIAYWRLNITSGGVITTDENNSTHIFEFNNPTVDQAVCTIDFNHTGDGKTVAGGTPHVYFSYSAPDNGGNIEFRKLSYSGGTWTLGAARNLDADYAFNDNIAAVFDGSRYVTAFVRNGSGSIVRIAERDAADTTTTVRTAPDPTQITNIEGLGVTYDAQGNIHVWATGQTYVLRIMYDRALDSWDGTWTTVATGTTGTYGSSMAVKAGYSESKIDALWQDFDAGSPYAVNYETVSLNTEPTAPTVDAPTTGSVANVAQPLTIDWTFNDPDAGDSQSAYSVRRRLGAGAYSYWNGTTWQASEDASTKIASTSTVLVLAAAWGSDGDADHYYSVKTWDAADAGPSPWSSEVRVVPSVQDNPTLTAPTGTVGATATATWTVATQTAYRVVVSDTSSTSDMDAGTLEYDSGWQSSGALSQAVSFPTNSVTRYVRVQTKNDEGLVSAIDQNTVTVSYTPVAAPTVAPTADSANGRIDVAISNPAGPPTPVSNDLYRREVGDTGDGIRVAASLPVDGSHADHFVRSGVAYEYRAKAYGDNTTSTFGSWTA